VGAGKILARQTKVAFLGRIPFDPEIVLSGDRGAPFAGRKVGGPSLAALGAVVERLGSREQAEDQARKTQQVHLVRLSEQAGSFLWARSSVPRRIVNLSAAIELGKNTLMITGFVGVMMLAIEYLNVLSRGAWQQKLAERRWGQYVLAAFLGATPGCLGAFAVVAMYAHGVVTLGAVVAAMIATAGDESFVMLAMIPKQAVVVHMVLFVIGLITGVLVDTVAGGLAAHLPVSCEGLEIHLEEDCECYPRGRVLRQLRQCSAARGTLTVALGLFVAAITAGQVGPRGWDWIRVTLLVTATSALFIVLTVPDHFLETHLWRHVARAHIPRVFLWTLGALLAVHFLTRGYHLEGMIQRGKWLVLLIACLVGLIPESGPHLIFVTLYAQGAVPLSILLASSIVQDGHGMLPMLAQSRRDFAVVKASAFGVGLTLGGAALSAGF
jgi:hypothetical protein